MQVVYSVFRFLRYLFPWQKRRFVAQVAGEVARQCHGDLWRYSCLKIREMGISEIRGYIRALAIGFAEREAEQVLARRHIDRRLLAEVVASAVEQLITLAIRDALTEQPACERKTIAA
jgi:hypothetical protein